MNDALARQARIAADYGVQETGMPVGMEYHQSVDHSEYLSLAEVARRGGKITRVRLLTERVMGGRVADVSYIHATLRDGTIVPVRPDFDSFLIPMNKIKATFIDWAKEQGVFAKGLGLLDEANWSVL